MITNNTLITKGFIIAGVMNASVLLFSKGFNNPIINKHDPVVMSNFGLLMILIWGLAYISVSKNYKQVKWLVAVFAIEKCIYGYMWLQWILKNSINKVFEEDTLAGIFYSIYGINDWLFFVFFMYVFIGLIKKNTI